MQTYTHSCNSLTRTQNSTHRPMSHAWSPSRSCWLHATQPSLSIILSNSCGSATPCLIHSSHATPCMCQRLTPLYKTNRTRIRHVPEVQFRTYSSVYPRHYLDTNHIPRQVCRRFSIMPNPPYRFMQIAHAWPHPCVPEVQPIA